MRSQWGARMNELISPNGYLVTLVFPIDGGRIGGPPYSVSPEVIATVLTEGSRSSSWERVYDEIPHVSEAGHEGRERMVVWRRNARGLDTPGL